MSGSTNTGNVGASYSDTNNGNKPIVFLHGLGLNKEFWLSTITHLSSSHRCIAVDLPGHGASKNVACDGSMSMYAQSVRGLIEQLNVHDVTLVGHSMGGQIAMILALQMPVVISKLVLVCSAGIETFTREEREQMRAGANAIWKNPVSEDFLRRVYAATNADRSYSLLSEHLQQQRDNFNSFSQLLCNSVSGMLDEPVFNFLPTLTQPALCIFGGADAAIPNRFIHPQMNVQQLGANAKAQVKNCEVIVMQGAGHYLPVEAATELAVHLKRFA